MGIELTSGDLLKADRVDALVNTVNCVGVMGKGIALQFKRKWPGNFRAYEEACARGDVQIGKMFVYELGALAVPKFIINFPTKEHWRGASKISYIADGLRALVDTIKEHGIRSIAIPPLGAGNGGLPWVDVRREIEKAFATLPDVRALVYEPNGAPHPAELAVETKRPAMTPARAALMKLLSVHQGLGYGLGKLEVQKLVYFLGAAGRPLPKIVFEKYPYGPYCDTLRHVLERMEGHFIRGLGDGSGEAEIVPVPEAIAAADEFLSAAQDDIGAQVNRIAQLISGFETPYGLELLSTVHWVAEHEDAHDAESAIKQVHAWSPRKKAAFQPRHIRIAWDRLQSTGWLGQRERNSIGVFEDAQRSGA